MKVNQHGKDITGQTFGRLIARKVVGQDKAGYFVWSCKCQCGNLVQVKSSRLRNGNTQSCGCLKKERIAKANSIHNMTNTQFYSTWANMKRRCLNQTGSDYKYYGGRGIKLAKRWYLFINFYIDMYHSYLEHRKQHGAKNTTIDRVNNNGNYSKSNCAWSTRRQQALNRRPKTI